MRTRLVASAVAAVAFVGFLSLPRIAGALSTEVFNSSFDNGLPAEMSAPGCGLDGVQGWAGLGTPGNQFSGSFLRYSTISIVDTKLTLHNLPAHDHVSISFLLAVIDSWDGTELLKVSVDGVEVFSNWFQLASGDASSYIAPPGGLLSSGTELGFSLGSWYARDRAYDMLVEPVFNDIPHTADSLVVTWYLGAVSGGAAANWQGGNDESWALDNVRVSVSGAATGIGGTPGLHALTLLGNAPNPFQASTTFRVCSPREDEAQVDVFDATGRRVRSTSARLTGGWQDMAFSGVDDHGRPLASGVYFYRVTGAGATQTRKMVIMR
ncbi:MAG: T9SS type A sorting domain-containing protein [Candidatus Krumholzibacteria bacterium]|nr:T9SS type A sorting domain-containing protein [Candidatus Krumholzibacteria bacterium]MDH4337419.1 T9SS type A sorting domain-containing protein [Candidatus Krumholzibacteria bacterium]